MSELSPSLHSNDVKRNCLFKDEHDDDDDDNVVCLCPNCERCDDDEDYNEETPTDSDLEFINDGAISTHTATSSSSSSDEDDDDYVYVQRRRRRIVSSEDEDSTPKITKPLVNDNSSSE